MVSDDQEKSRGPRVNPAGNSTNVRLVSLRSRPSKVQTKFLGRNPRRGAKFQDFFYGLPAILAAAGLRRFIDRMSAARRRGRPVLMMFGAHVIKTGLTRYVLSLIKGGWVTALATNGASVIHDFELAYAGHTSEDVEDHLRRGIFGFARETGEHLNAWAREAEASGRGLGEYIGERLATSRFPNRRLSLLAAAYEAGVPVTVHAAIGTDIVYQHPGCDGGAWGAASMRDFRALTGIIGDLADGGVAMNWGSAVLMPEIFLKAVAVNRNLGRRFRGLTTANFDMFVHYRPRMNILDRPTKGVPQAESFNFIGHHEIMLPLVAHALADRGPLGSKARA